MIRVRPTGGVKDQSRGVGHPGAVVLIFGAGAFENEIENSLRVSVFWNLKPRRVDRFDEGQVTELEAPVALAIERSRGELGDHRFSSTNAGDGGGSVGCSTAPGDSGSAVCLT